MWVYFNTKGQVKEILTHGNPARAGTNSFEIFCFFEEVDIDVAYNLATISLVKPDLHNTVYSHLTMRATTKRFNKEEDDGEVNFFEDGQRYYGYVFDFADFERGQDDVVLLDTSGNWSAVVTLFSSGIEKNVQGAFRFFVADGVESEKGFSFNIEEYLEEIINNLAKYLPKNSKYFIRSVENIDDDVKNGSYPSDLYSVGSVIFEKTTGYIYELNNNLLYEPGVNPAKIGSTKGTEISVLDSYVNKDLSTLPEINCKEMSIIEQGSAMIYVDNNGTPSRVSANNLDYSKITVQNSENLDNVREKDFAFITK